jgi:hypothetical protein
LRPDSTAPRAAQAGVSLSRRETRDRGLGELMAMVLIFDFGGCISDQRSAS